MTDASEPGGSTANAPGERTAALLAEVERLDAALHRGGDRVPPEIRERVSVLLAGVRDRLALGVDHTVVALVGGTGSGKSTVFNALTGLDFAEVGVRRPTTSQVTACVWAHDASALLDWLGVERDRRIERESELDGETQADLRGLVLLDVPDHDSIEAAHHAVVDRLIPQVDLMCWVVDPQKYADDALHSGYLRHLAGHEGAMLVVLNQVDTVPPGHRGQLMADVARLVRADGLADVRTLAVSATTGDSMDTLRAVLAQTVADRGVAELRAAAELHDAAAALAAVVGPSEPDLPVARAVDALLEAAGVPGEVAAIARGAPAASEPTLQAPTLGPVQVDRASLVREAWLADVSGPLPAPWAEALDATVADDDALVRAVDDALAQVSVPAPPRGRVAWWVAWPLGLAVVAAGVAGVLWAPWWWAVAGALVLVAVLLPWSAARRRRAALQAAGARLLAAGRAAVVGAVESELAAPSRAVLEDHRAVREASSTSPASAGSSTD
ncbi:MAG: 50S ribosome-binding GTPase [Actinomycetales bacterium]|nr:50S ribosome-binding GTPase [Actinomycetales bacterium]